MNNRLTKMITLPFLCALLMLGGAASAQALEISITVAPNVINIQSQTHVVTVHTGIAYGAVDGHTVYLNGVEINSWKSDNRGYFVAKFLMRDIKGLPGLVYGEYNEFELEGVTYGGEAFWGVDEVLIVNNQPSGTGRK